MGPDPVGRGGSGDAAAALAAFLLGGGFRRFLLSHHLERERLGVGDRFLAVPPKGPGQQKFFCALREEYPDVYVLFTNSFRGDLAAKMMDAPQRFGIVRPGKWRPFLTQAWRVPPELDEAKIPMVRLWEKFFQHFGLREELDLSPVTWPTSGQKPAALSIGLICGTENSPEKRWPVERWRELMQGLAADYAGGVAGVSPREAKVCRYCARQALCRVDSVVADEDDDGDEAGA